VQFGFIKKIPSPCGRVAVICFDCGGDLILATTDAKG
jgi:hypothetical protein